MLSFVRKYKVKVLMESIKASLSLCVGITLFQCQKAAVCTVGAVVPSISDIS